MLSQRRIVVVMPAYNAEHTIERTWREIPHDVVDHVIVVDDGSSDRTVEVVRSLGLELYLHDRNRGYGANQKTCYAAALGSGADIVVMLHPDYQYPPKLITAMAAMLVADEFDAVLGSRILAGEAVRRGMPLYKYVANRALTVFENLMFGVTLSEYHTGYRAFTRSLLETVPLLRNADGFTFDAEMLAQVIHFGFRIGEVTSPARYHAEASSIGLGASVRYGFGVLGAATKYRLQKAGLARFELFDEHGARLTAHAAAGR